MSRLDEMRGTLYVALTTYGYTMRHPNDALHYQRRDPKPTEINHDSGDEDEDS